VYFGKQEEPLVFFFSPMHSQPLGQELPSIHMACRCVPVKERVLKRKVWLVKQQGHNKMALSKVVIVIKCLLCGESYNLRASNYQGVLCKIGGLYAAVVPFFIP
jgi:hypothetical protein